MKTIRGLYLLPLAIFLLSAIVTFSPTADAQMIRSLLVGVDEKDKSSYVKNVEKINQFLDQVMNVKDGDEQVCYVNRDRFDWTTRSSTSLSERIEQWVKKNSPDKNDVVFIYYSRPSEDTDHVARLHTLMKRMRCRLKILVTDTDIHTAGNVNRSGQTNRSNLPAWVVSMLFLEHKGFLYLTNRAENEVAFGDTNGGWFTDALVDTLYMAGAKANENEPELWKAVLTETQEQTKQLFKKNIPDSTLEMMEVKSQTPQLIGELPVPHPSVHALLVTTDIIIDKAVSDWNHTRIRGLLLNAESFGICNVHLKSLRSSEGRVTPDEIRAWVKSVRPRESDTVFIYYSGYAGDTVDAASQKELVQALEDAIKSRNVKQSRLQMLMVDTYEVGPGLVIPDYSTAYPQTVVHNLFIEHKGLLHLMSSADDELAFADRYEGGWFTDAFIDTLYNIRENEDYPKQVPDNGPDRPFVEWKEVFEEMRNITTDVFNKRYPREFVEQSGRHPKYPANFSSAKVLEALDQSGIKKSQTPQAHELPKRND